MNKANVIETLIWSEGEGYLTGNTAWSGVDEENKSEQSVELNEILQANLEEFQKNIGEQILVLLKLASSCTRISIWPDCFEQFLANLVVHTRESMPDGGKLYFETSLVALDPNRISFGSQSASGVLVGLLIQDNGRGMELETCERFLESLFASKQEIYSEKERMHARGGFKREQGHIEIESRMGMGTAIRMYFPMVLRSSASERKGDRFPLDVL